MRLGVAHSSVRSPDGESTRDPTSPGEQSAWDIASGAGATIAEDCSADTPRAMALTAGRTKRAVPHPLDEPQLISGIGIPGPEGGGAGRLPLLLAPSGALGAGASPDLSSGEPVAMRRWDGFNSPGGAALNDSLPREPRDRRLERDRPLRLGSRASREGGFWPPSI